MSCSCSTHLPFSVYYNPFFFNESDFILAQNHLEALRKEVTSPCY